MAVVMSNTFFGEEVSFVDAREDDWVSCPKCNLTWSLHARYRELVKGK
jgi:hypothetical protein